MNVIKTKIEGVVIIEPRVFRDDRGYFFESFSQQRFNELVAPVTFVQDNESPMGYCVAYTFRNRPMHNLNWCA